MRINQIEAIILRAVEQIERNEPVEDQRLELKREWPNDPIKTARQLAGFCNAALGELAVFVIGISETEGVSGCEHQELSVWWNSVEAYFVDPAPSFRSFVLSIDNKTVVALAFDTTRAPYLVKLSGKVESEVPWRQGNHTRTARRTELLRMLADGVRIPEIMTQRASISLEPVLGPFENYGRERRISAEEVFLTVELYIAGHRGEVLVLPNHLVSVDLQYVTDGDLKWIHKVDQPEVRYLGPRRRKYANPGDVPVFPTDTRLSRTIDSTPTEALVEGPGMLVCTLLIGLVEPTSVMPIYKAPEIKGVLHLTAVPGMIPLPVHFQNEIQRIPAGGPLSPE